MMKTLAGAWGKVNGVSWDSIQEKKRMTRLSVK
jgi:hypothetical protein